MSARKEKAQDLIKELEALRNYLLDDSSNSELEDFIDQPDSQPQLNNKPAPVAYLNVKSAPHISEAMKEELRSKAAPLIQEIVDREMIQLEHQLISTINNHLEQWMDNYNSAQRKAFNPSFRHTHQQ